MTVTAVEAGQWRRGAFGTIWAVLHAHPTRRGFWVAVDSHFAYTVAPLGRRELEAMPLVSRDYFGGREHPGEAYLASFREAVVSTRRSWTA